jgi:alkanesulfonate monooxygenase SsuD/methylene tetrahydromethanopterin reductase-like flavin-dependent oxidoreductase (luciferase family)
MSSFHPAAAPPGRLVRLGVVLDTRNPAGRLCEIARMCDHAGVDALWVRDGLPPLGSAVHAAEARLEAWTALNLAAGSTRRARIGAMLAVDVRPPAMSAAMAAALAESSDGRLEIGFAAGPSASAFEESWPGSPDAAARGFRIETYLIAVRRLLRADAPDAAAGVAPSGPREPGPGGRSPAPVPGSDGPPLAVEARSAAEIDVAARVADDVVLVFAGKVDLAAAIGRVPRACAAAGRAAGSLGIGVMLPISIGRTSAEAHARADADPLFRGANDPSRAGIVGTLEQCQRRVIELAHAGVTDLRCILPNASDVPDVIAQLTAMVVGTRTALRPDAPRSRDPDPPPGWGGRRPGRTDG